MVRPGMVMTVTGPISPGELGKVAVHEHIYIDIVKPWLYSGSNSERKRALQYRKVTIGVLGILRRDPNICRDNLRYNDDKLALDEVSEFKEAGGNTIIDVTNKYIGRNPRGLRKIARATGLNVIGATGFYVQKAHPAFVKRSSAEDLAKLMVRDLVNGMDDTEIKAGIIGEIGTSISITESEEKVLRASAMAHVETGAPISIHSEKGARTGMKVIDTLEKGGVDPGRIVIGHCDDGISAPKGMDVSYQEAMADRGAYVAYDGFGQEEYFESAWSLAGTEMEAARDTHRIDCVKQLVDHGYASHLLLSSDVCYRTHLTSYGGHGFGHVLTNIVPRLSLKGIRRKDIDAMLISNPRRLFS